MPSRMERYYHADSEIKQRTRRNQELYKKIYEGGEYTNIEGIASIGSTNEIDISKIKQMLQNREDYKREKKYRGIIPKEESIEIPIIEEPDEDRNYDIRDVLNKAKVERTDSDNKQRSLRNTQYNILKSLQMDEDKNYTKYSDLEKEEDELKELINTITSTSMLNKMNDRDLCLDLFQDLKSSDNTMVGTSSSIQSLLKEEKERYKQEKEEDDDEKLEMDKSFYTSSLGFGEDDFEDLQEMKHTMKKHSLMMKIVLFLLFVIIITAVIFVVMNYVL